MFSYDTTLSDVCSALATRWSSAADDALSAFSAADLEPLSSYEVKEFLSQLLEEVRPSECEVTGATPHSAATPTSKLSLGR